VGYFELKLHINTLGTSEIFFLHLVKRALYHPFKCHSLFFSQSKARVSSPKNENDVIRILIMDEDRTICDSPELRKVAKAQIDVNAA